MRQIKWNILLLITLAILLTAGVSNVGLNSRASTDGTEQQNEAQKMKVALVNEDQGANFEGSNITFGNQFVKKIEKDESNDWYVVSRGVAESGLKKDMYNLMIVIPSDFSEKALSMTSQSPEKAAVSYKINDIGNKDLKAEAEKTASQILEDMNKTVIDVYFVSILTNLQQAQDNIQTLVNKEKAYSDIYNTNINGPLSNYTEQFQTVQDYTGTSKDNFKSFQDLLQGYDTILKEAGKGNTEYMAQLDAYMKQQEANAPYKQTFQDRLTSLNAALSSDSVQTQLTALQQANALIYSEFQGMNNTSSLLARTQALKQSIADANTKISAMNEELLATINSNLQTTVAEDLARILRQNNAGSEQTFYLKDLASEDINARFKDEIAKVIQQLPTMDADKLAESGLSTDAYQNVIQLSQKYIQDNPSLFSGGVEENGAGTTASLNNLQEKTLKSLKKKGVDLESQLVEIQQSEHPSTIYLTLMDDFSFDNIWIVDESGKPIKILESESYSGNGMKIKIPSDSNQIKITAHAKLDEEVSQISLFGSVDWAAAIQQQEQLTLPKNDEESGNTEKQPETANPKEGAGNKEEQPETTNPEKESGNTEEQPETTNPAEESGNTEGQPETTAPEDGTENSKEQPETTVPEEDSGNTEGQAQTSSTEEAGQLEQTQSGGSTALSLPLAAEQSEETLMSNKEVQMIDVNHPSILDDTSQVGNAIYETVKNYERLAVLYKLYYGLDVENNDDMPNFQDTGWKLDSIAKPTSYAYVFNNEDVLNKILALSSGQITSAYRSKLQEYKGQITDYQAALENISSHSTELMNRLAQTNQEAVRLNDNLGKMLTELETWREHSMKLVDDNNVVIENIQNEQTMVMELSNGFTGILENSKQLADTTGVNLDSAEVVYKTFDAIDQEAKDIQGSGVQLIDEAANLSDNLAKKLQEDETFQQNFADVMSNSRAEEGQNENLYDFLSNPVEKMNAGTIIAGDKSTPYSIVLICAITALFTGYVLANQEKKRRQRDDFAEEMSLAVRNMPITILMVGVAIVEGLIIGAVSGNLLDTGQIGLFIWMSVIMLIMLALVSFCTYMLRQLKMVGMFIILAFLSLYLFLTDAVGLHSESESGFTRLKDFSPLQYIEQLINNMLNGQGSYGVIVSSLIAVVIVFIGLNVFVWHRAQQSEETIADEA